MKSELPPLRFVCVSGFWDKLLWETELHQMMFQKLGHFPHPIPFSNFHEQYLKNNPNNWKWLNSNASNSSSVQMEKKWIITVIELHSRVRLIIAMAVLIHTLNGSVITTKWTGLLYRNSMQTYLNCRRTQFSKAKDRRSNPNCSSSKPTPPPSFSS